MTLAANYLELAERHSDCVNRPLASGGNTSGNVKESTALGRQSFLHDWDVAAARWWDEGGSSLSCDGRASTRFVVQNTAMSNHRESPAGSTGTIFAAISMFASACVGGRALPLGATLAALWRTNGGRIGSIWAPRDSVWNRRDGSRVHP